MTAGSLPAEHFRKVPMAEATEPRSGSVEVYRDYWWFVTEDDCLLFYTRGIRRYFGSPQCNSQEGTARVLNDRSGYPMPTTVQQIPLVFVPHRCEDYR